MADIYKIEMNMTSKQMEELEKCASAQKQPTARAMIIDFVKESLKAYRNNILKRDADLDNIL